MIARVRTVRLAPGGLVQAIEIVRDDELPLLRQQPGFIGMLVLASLSDSAAGERVEVVGLWDDRQSIDAFDATRDDDAPGIRTMPLLAGPIETHFYEVALAAGMAGGMFARFISVQLHPGYVERVVTLFENVVMHAATEQQGFRRGLLLVDRESHHAISIGLWNSVHDLQASELAGYLSQQVANFTQIVASPIAPETLTVVIEG